MCVYIYVCVLTSFLCGLPLFPMQLLLHKLKSLWGWRSEWLALAFTLCAK